ncbi:MAG TPA: hypothetical protein VFE58_12200 [Tepidisphaeraceae bacterium]|nr:hypothetical protein [Tepidisphaeraceae bacterium]
MGQGSVEGFGMRKRMKSFEDAGREGDIFMCCIDKALGDFMPEKMG